MAPDHAASGDALFLRADRAIADAAAARAEAQAGLRAAGRSPIHRAGHDARHPLPAHPEPVPDRLLEPWWSVARSLLSARETTRTADAALERSLCRAPSTISTPLDLLRE